METYNPKRSSKKFKPEELDETGVPYPSCKMREESLSDKIHRAVDIYDGNDAVITTDLKEKIQNAMNRIKKIEITKMSCVEFDIEIEEIFKEEFGDKLTK